MNIFTLTGTILVDSAKAQESISKTGEQAEGLGSKLAGGIKTAAKWASGVTAAAVAVGGAMIKASKDTAAAMDTVDKGAQRMKISTDAFQELSYAADLSGVSMSTLEKAAKKVEDSIDETLTYCEFPSEHWTRIRTNNVIERLNREIRRRTRVVGCFPDGNSALMLVCARLRHVAGTQWGNKKYMNMKHLEALLDDAYLAG